MNGLLDTGSTPVYSTIKKGFEIPYFMVFRAFLLPFNSILNRFKPSKIKKSVVKSVVKIQAIVMIKTAHPIN